jgi:hypothetical protein
MEKSWHQLALMGVIVWDVKTEAHVKTYTSETFHTLYDVAYSPDGSRLLVASDGGYLEAVYNILEEPCTRGNTLQSLCFTAYHYWRSRI